MDAGRIAYNPRSQGLYSSRSVSLFKISMFTSFIAIVVGGVGPKLGGQDHLQPRMGPPRHGQSVRQGDIVWHYQCGHVR